MPGKVPVKSPNGDGRHAIRPGTRIRSSGILRDVRRLYAALDR